MLEELAVTVKGELTVEGIDQLISELENNDLGLFHTLIPRLVQLKQDLQTATGNGVGRVAELLKESEEAFIQANDSIMSGKLLGSITVEQNGEMEYKVGTNLEEFYPICVELGRGEVRPLGPGYPLHWVDKSGNDIFRYYAGPASPRPFVAPAITAAKTNIEPIFMEEIKNVI